MKIYSTFFFAVAVFAVAGNSLATEIRERNFQFENSGIVYQNDPTFVVGNFEKEKKPAIPKLVLTMKQNPENEQIVVPAATPVKNQVEKNDPKEAYDSITQCFMNPIYFQFNKSVLTRTEQEKLFAYLGECKEKKTPLVVVGYTCNIGSIEQNKKIAENRAAYIAQVLLQNGFNVIESVGKPKSNFVTYDTKMQHLNRRVVIAKAEHQQETK
ncbi:MAG: OmpA protein [uncultured bacterium]|nr:MAG: OmpA protein [uncultured bacterium]